MKSHHFPWLALRCARGLAAVLMSWLVVGPVSALAADGSWHLNHLELQRPSPAQLGKTCSYQGDGGRNSNIGGGNFETRCYSPALGTTDTWSGNMGWSYVTQGFQPPAAGLFNEGLDILVPGRLIGFSVNAASTTARATVSGQVLVRTMHPAAGTLTVVATPYTAPKGKAAALGYGKVFGKPGLLPNGAVPQLRLSFALLGTNASQGIQVHLLYDWVDAGNRGLVPPATPSPAAPPPPTSSPAPPSLGPQATRPTVPAGPRSLGCFRDDRWNRDLNGYTYNTPGMTTRACLSACAERGFRYAATQYSTHCFCANAYGKFGAATGCNMPCGGNKAEMCGGYSVNSVYPTGR